MVWVCVLFPCRAILYCSAAKHYLRQRRGQFFCPEVGLCSTWLRTCDVGKKVTRPLSLPSWHPALRRRVLSSVLTRGRSRAWHHHPSFRYNNAAASNLATDKVTDKWLFYRCHRYVRWLHQVAETLGWLCISSLCRTREIFLT